MDATTTVIQVIIDDIDRRIAKASETEISWLLAMFEARSIVQNGLIKHLLELPDTPKRHSQKRATPSAAVSSGETETQTENRRRSERVSGDDILDYLWQHEGSTRFEYILRDLYDSHVKDGRVSNLNKALKRLEMLGDVHLDREDGKIVVATARRMPREA